jgi:hypothetical protein
VQEALKRARDAAFAAGDFSTAGQNARGFQLPSRRVPNHEAGEAWQSGDLSKNQDQRQSVASTSIPGNAGVAPKSEGSIKR